MYKGLIRAGWSPWPLDYIPGGNGPWRMDTETNVYVSGSGYTPEHDGHPVDGHGVALPYVRTQVAQGTVIINGMPPVVEGDTGDWNDPDTGPQAYVVARNPFGVYVEGKSVAVEGIAMIDSGSLFGGSGTLNTCGSPNVFVGMMS